MTGVIGKPKLSVKLLAGMFAIGFVAGFFVGPVLLRSFASALKPIFVASNSGETNIFRLRFAMGAALLFASAPIDVAIAGRVSSLRSLVVYLGIALITSAGVFWFFHGLPLDYDYMIRTEAMWPMVTTGDLPSAEIPIVGAVITLFVALCDRFLMRYIRHRSREVQAAVRHEY